LIDTFAQNIKITRVKNLILLFFGILTNFSSKIKEIKDKILDCEFPKSGQHLLILIVVYINLITLIYPVRNALGAWKTIIDWNNNKIQWHHIVDLYEHQKEHGFTLANKLTKQHILFEKNPMRVKFAVQVISQSVANGLLTMFDLKGTHP